MTQREEVKKVTNWSEVDARLSEVNYLVGQLEVRLDQYMEVLEEEIISPHTMHEIQAKAIRIDIEATQLWLAKVVQRLKVSR